MSAIKNITRLHHHDAIYLPRPQSLAMVLMVFNFIIKKSETKEETEREGKKNNILPSHHLLLLLIPISSLRPRTALLAGNSFIVRCHVTSKKPMREHASKQKISRFSIYTLSDLGDLSNLIGSLSRTIQQYSPPSEWIMCELGFFPIFLGKDLLKVEKILGLTIFSGKKRLRRIQNGVFSINGQC